MLHKEREHFKFQERIIINTLGRLPITPNQWTVISLIVALIGLYFVIVQDFFVATVLFLFSLLLDLVDGSIARARGMASNTGAYVDTIVDRYVEAIMLLGLFFVPQLSSILIPISVWIFLTLFGSMVTTYSKAATGEKELSKEAIKKTLKAKGLIKRAERVFTSFLIYVFIVLGQFYIATIILILFAVLTNITAVRKILRFIHYNNKLGFKKAKVISQSENLN